MATPADLADRTKPVRATTWSCRGAALSSSSAVDLISDQPNRWDGEGEPTIYLSGDPALGLVESGRHPDDLEGHSQLVSVDLDLPRAVNLRDGSVREALGLPDDLDWILDRDRTRGVAQAIRRSSAADGLLVPSAGALDQPQRWNAVVFADDRARVAASLARPRPGGEVRVADPRDEVDSVARRSHTCKTPHHRGADLLFPEATDDHPAGGKGRRRQAA